MRSLSLETTWTLEAADELGQTIRDAVSDARKHDPFGGLPMPSFADSGLRTKAMGAGISS